MLHHDFCRFSFLSASTARLDPEVWQTVFSCLRNLHSLEMMYQSRQSEEPVIRRIDPYHGVRFDGDRYVVGHCHLRNEIRTFSLARITRARKLPERFRIPPDFNFHKHTGSHFGVHWTDDEIPVRIRFDRSAARFIRERNWHPSQRIEEQEDRSLILTLTVNHLLELKRWVHSGAAPPGCWSQQSLRSRCGRNAGKWTECTPVDILPGLYLTHRGQS